MAERTVHARIISLGDTRQVNYTNRKTGQPATASFFDMECEINGEAVTIGCGGWFKAELVAGSSYELIVEDNPNKAEYPDNPDKLKKVVAMLPSDGNVPPPPPPVVPPVAQAQPTPGPQPAQPQQAARSFVPPDTGSRWREYNTNSRAFMMDAKDMVRIYADLLIAGRFDTEDEKIVVNRTIVQNWEIEEYDRHWTLYNSYPPQDIYGDMFENSANQGDS